MAYQAMMDREQKQEYKSPIDEKFIDNLNSKLIKWGSGKQFLENKIIDNDRWFRSQYWDFIRKRQKSDEDIEPVSQYLFSILANKHADEMDYYPEPNILEREEDDVDESQNLSEVVPLVLEQNNFRGVYSDAKWYKLKNGTVPWGIFWNPNLCDGQGDIDIVKLDLLNIYWQPGITDIQKSPVLFILTLMDDEVIEQMWPVTKGKITGAQKPLNIKTYFTDDTLDLTDKSIIVDAYYKKLVETENGAWKQVLHLCKYVDSIKLAATEDEEDLLDTGLYDHGQYPVIFETLFPEENSPAGFGLVDIAKNPTMYVDKLDQIIMNNAVVSGKQRYFVDESGNINEEDLADLSKDIVHCKRPPREGENFSVLQGRPLPAFIQSHRSNKISELKDVTGTMDFSRGNSAGGVTAASAIAMLQEAGSKTSRDMIHGSYMAYTKIVYMVIELIRQFYDEDRKFRSETADGEPKYISYNNQRLQPQPVQPAYPGEPQKFRKAMFDIKVKPERASPYSRIAQNEMSKELFNIGFFNPQRAVEAKLALEMMSFEGKEKIFKMIAENGDLMMQVQQLMQQLQQANQTIQAMQQIQIQMNEVIKKVTGKDMFATQPQAPQPPIEEPAQIGQMGGGMGG